MNGSKPWENGILRVSDNGRYLLNGEKPFFFLGDTAWLLFQRLNSEEACTYLEDRRGKSFNVILSVLLNAASDGDKTSYQSLENCDVSDAVQPGNEAYWRHVEDIVDKAESLGLYMALLPCWGRIVKQGWLNMDNLEEYINFLTGRFGKKKNIIWILGGDIRGSEHAALWNKAGTMLKKQMPDTLIGFHPFGRTSSSYWFHSEKWLDFNMFQSGHRRHDQISMNPTEGLFDNAIPGEPWHGEDNWKYVAADREKLPAKPVLDGEPSYEQIPHGLHDFTQPRWQAHHVRRYAYWSVLSGACGHVYGHNSIMQFNGKGFRPAFGAEETWEEALWADGAGNMSVLKGIMAENGFASGKPMNDIIDRNGEGDGKIFAFGGEQAVIVYNYEGGEFSLTHDQNRDFRCAWVHTETGVQTYIGVRKLNETLFTPPVKKLGHNDWLLLLKPENVYSELI